VIINAKQLATTPLRKDALRILNAGYEAIDIRKLVQRKFRRTKGTLCIEDVNQKCIYVDLADFNRIFVVGIGKGSAVATKTLADILGQQLTRAIALDVAPLRIKNSRCAVLTGTHPFPSEKNVRATKKIIDLAKNLTEKDAVFFFICGGGSALAMGSREEFHSVSRATHALMAGGADILELNTVRKHLSAIKGGGLARLCYPATVFSLVASDVLGNDVSMVASGLLARDRTTKDSAVRILKKYGLNPRQFFLRETPKDKKFFKKVTSILIASNADAAVAMEHEARRLGFKPRIRSLVIRGEARTLFAPFLRTIKRGEAVIAAGETTVTLQKSEGSPRRRVKGGRNQEAVLGALSLLPRSVLIASLASDGRDNTDAAGAMADGATVKKAKEKNLDAREFLGTHDSYPFFLETRGLVFADQRGFNIADFMLVLRR